MGYTNYATDDLLRRYRRLDGNTSAMTTESEMQRMYALQCMADELNRRDKNWPSRLRDLLGD